MITRILKLVFGVGLALSGMAVADRASAQVTQTDAAMTSLPQPVGMAEWNLVTMSWARNTETLSYRDPETGADLMGMTIRYGDYYSPPAYPQFEDGDAITLEGLFKWRGEQIDPVADAKTGPGYFSPTCGFSGQLVLLGGNCQVSFGWYNVEDPNSTTPPAPSEIYEFIPSDPTYLNCLNENGDAKTDGFCPLAWDTRSPRNLYIRQWTPMAFDSGAIKTDPNYKGKYVGFAVIGNPATSCTQNKYSMYEYNQKNASGTPWVTTLVYQSTVDPEGFYMAFEDLPMAADDWHKTGVSGSNATNDGDFNDFVFYISGIACNGGGESCDSGLQGACSLGRTDCTVGDVAGECRPIVTPAAELCDNVDNDCNGVVDDGEGLCAAGQVCDKGSCVNPCNTGEFRCPDAYTCQDSHCVETACAGVECPAGQACRGGNCQNPCDGIVCNIPGQECQLGYCVDPCKDIMCPAGKVCERGLCLSDCACRGCKEGFECAADGKCVDSACEGVTCPDGQVCVTGQCTAPCVCPNGNACVNGTCADQMGSGGSGGGVIIVGGGSTSTSSGGTSASSGARRAPSQAPGCACSVPGQSQAGRIAALLALLGVGALFARRRRAA